MALKIGRMLSVARQLDMLWENWRQLIALGFLEGNIVTADGFESLIKIRHGLGRQPRGWLTLRNQNVSLFYETAADDVEITFATVTSFPDDTHLTLLVY